MQEFDGLRVRGLTKSYGSLAVLDSIDIDFAAGEVHALLGANGAGKSTLIACLGGATRQDSGEVTLGSTSSQGFHPKEAIDSGIAVIYQHFQLIGSLSVADNIFLGSEETRGLLVDRASQRTQAAELVQRLGLDIDPDRLVETLSTGEQQAVEIARALRRNPRVLILDEPTAALGKHEIEALLALVKRLATELGMVVIYVTHLLGEVVQVADRVTILRGGEVLWTRSADQVTMPDLIEGISPRKEGDRTREARELGSELVRLADFRTSYVGPLDLSIRGGEIIGVFGLLGSGRTNLLETLAGARAPRSGAFAIAGQPLTRPGIGRARARGVALVAADRVVQSLFPTMTAIENLLLPTLTKIGRVLRRPRLEREVFDRIAGQVSLVPAEPSRLAVSFSGGNAQKLVVGRWLDDRGGVRLLLLDEPTQGVDIGSRHEIYQLLRSLVSGHDRAVVFATSEPEEAVELADRVIVLKDGAPVAILDGPGDEETLLALAQGVSTERKAS